MGYNPSSTNCLIFLPSRPKRPLWNVALGSLAARLSQPLHKSYNDASKKCRLPASFWPAQRANHAHASLQKLTVCKETPHFSLSLLQQTHAERVKDSPTRAKQQQLSFLQPFAPSSRAKFDNCPFFAQDKTTPPKLCWRAVTGCCCL